MLTLYAAKGTIAVACHIALEETGLPYRIEWLDFSQGDQHSPDYLLQNPKGRVPTLVTDHGPLTETPAILEYIAQTAGKLMPGGAFEQARTREIMAYCASTFHVNHAHRLRQSRWTDDEGSHAAMAAKVPETMGDSCAYIENELPDAGWIAGEYTIADIHLCAICRWLAVDGVDINAYPKLSAHFAAMNARPAVARVLEIHG